MGTTIVAAIEKGGVGKTTVIINLAALFGMRGKHTLVVDMDPQGNCTRTLSGGKTKDDFEGRGVFDMLHGIGETAAREYIFPTPIKNVDIIPASQASGQMLNLFPVLKERYGNPEYVYLGARLSEIADDYDYIFIDTPPSMNALTISSLYAGDYVIVPVLADGYSMDGMAAVYSAVDSLNEAEKCDIRMLGVLLNKTERSSSAKYIREQLKQSDFANDLFETEIRKSVAVADSTLFSLPVVVSAPKSPAARGYVDLYKEVTERLKGEWNG